MTFVHAPDFVSLSEMPFLRSLTTQKRRPNLLVACTGPSVDGAVAQLAAVCAPPTRIYKLPGTVDLPACGGGTILLDDVSALTRPPRPEARMDPERAKKLYVSNDPDDNSLGHDFQRDVDQKKKIDERFAEASKGVMDFQKITYRSSVGDLDIPAYLFQPLNKRGPKGHAAMVWVHGGVHGNMDLLYFPFIKEAVERGYVIVTPEYRGSTGFGQAYHKA